MKLRKRGPEPTHDWPAIYKRWEASPLNLVKFCEKENLPYKYTHKVISDMEVIEQEANKMLTTRILNANSPKAALRLAQLLDSEDEKVIKSSSDSILDRSGHSVQALNLQVTNNTITQVLIAPILAAQAETVLNSFLGAKNADTESND